MDDHAVPMQVMQAQRIKVLEAEKADLQQQVMRLQARLDALQTVSVLPSLPRGRRPTYTVELLRQVWIAHAAGEPLESVAKRLGADTKMMRIFVKGEYWTEAAKAVYEQFGVARAAGRQIGPGSNGPQTV